MDFIKIKDRKTGEIVKEKTPNVGLLKFIFSNPF